jgi:phosphate uptake regulator
LSAAHKAGFDEIEILYEDPSIVKVAYELVKELYMGFSVVEQTNKRCVLKAISRDKVEDFNTILRRAFIVALSMADSSLEMIKNKQFSDLNSLISLEHFNNQLTNFCERALNKKEYKNGNCFYYVVAWNLEKVCDNYKYICDKHSEAKDVNKKILDFYKKTNDFFRGYYELFYKFDNNSLVRLTNKGKELIKESNKLHKNANDFEFIILSSLRDVILQCLDFSASYIAIKGFKE